MRAKGFTLIKLVVVIVTLGIIAVTVAPKFIDLTGEARTATLEGVKASIHVTTMWPTNAQFISAPITRI